MIRTLSRVAGSSAALVLLIQAGCAAQGTPSGASSTGESASSAGSVSSGAGGAASSSAGSPAAAGAGSNVAGASTGGSSAGGSSTGGSSTGGSSGGSSATAGSAGTSTGGAGGTAGSASTSGLGGTVNQYGTIIGSPAAATLVAMTSNCTDANKIPSDTGKFMTDDNKVIHVCALKGGGDNSGGAVYYTADMDIDCDGLMTTHCPGTGADKDGSYYGQTSFYGPNSAKGKYGQTLAAENTPYVVIPEEVKFTGLDQNKGGNIVAVIYKGQIEFAVFGDTIAYQAGDKGEPTGEASVRAAVGLGIPASPANGGAAGGVTYIAFAGPGSQPKDMENLAEVQALGMKLLTALLANNK